MILAYKFFCGNSPIHSRYRIWN